MTSPIDAVGTYILAKDGNRPHLLAQVFTDDAELQMVVKTDAISFPEAARGRSAIADILVREFNADHENIYTFGLSPGEALDVNHFGCHWLVGMSVRKSGEIRVGCGRYDWYFAPDDRGFVERLVITIEVMSRFPATDLGNLMNWLAGLPYPWSSPQTAVDSLPEVNGLAPIEGYLTALRRP